MDFISSTIIQLQVNLTGTNVTLPVLPPLTLANAFGDATGALIIVTLMLSMTIRTMSEYLQKWMKGEIATFDRKYIATAVIAFISSMPLALAIFPEAAKIFLAYFGTGGVAGAIIMVAFYGYGWNHGVNKLSSLLGHFFTSKPETDEGQSPTTTTTPPPPNP